MFLLFSVLLFLCTLLFVCLIFSARDYVVECRDTRGVRMHRYNPYTEPSMEIFHWHHGLNKYVEIGNSGPPHTHATC